MADKETQSRPSGPPPDADSNGNGQAKFVPGQQEGTRHDGHDASKYKPPKKEEGPAAAKDDGKKPASPQRRLIIGVIALVVLAFALIKGLAYYHYSQTHVATDDAYITGNLVNVSPIISGTLTTLTVDEGNFVKKGQLIGQLDTSGPLASLRQARASYQAAESQIPQARTTLSYEKQATAAAIQKAQAEIAAQRAKTAGAQAQVALSAATSRNQVRQAQSQIVQAQAQYRQAQAQAVSYQAAIQTQRQAVQTAQRAADAAASQVQAAKANAVKAAKDQARYAVLLQQEAVTPQQYDATLAAAQNSQAELEAAQNQQAQAVSQVDQARSAVGQAAAQYDAALRQADAADEQIGVTRAGLGVASANLINVPIQRSNVLNNVQQAGSAEADLATAQAGASQISLRRQQITTIQAQALQAKAALANAQVAYNDCFLYAPIDGEVVKKAVNIGSSLSPGQTVVTVSQSNYVWVEANFKETQLTDVKPGQDAEVEVDSFPHLVFHGYVQAINEATGAATALLPPDNATGNFTKVVQRIPVRIAVYAADDNEDKQYARAADIQKLRQGMSVTATIDTSEDSGKAHRDHPQNNGGNGPGGQADTGGTVSGGGSPGTSGGGTMGISPSSGGSSASQGSGDGRLQRDVKHGRDGGQLIPGVPSGGNTSNGMQWPLRRCQSWNRCRQAATRAGVTAGSPGGISLERQQCGAGSNNAAGRLRRR